MNIKKVMNETLVANNGEISRGLKNQLNLLPLIDDQNLDEKLDCLKNAGISVYNYFGLRILEFDLKNIENILQNNISKLETYSTNPQELVRDLRKSEIEKNGSSLELDQTGGV